MENTKMYFLVRESIPLGMAMAGVAHASMAASDKWLYNPSMVMWKQKSFKKVICKVTDKEFEEAKKFDDSIIMTESALDNAETVIAFAPRSEWPEAFKDYRLYK